MVVQVHRGPDPSRLPPVVHHPDAAKAQVPCKGDLQAGAKRVDVDGCREADHGDYVQIVEYLHRWAQKLIIRFVVAAPHQLHEKGQLRAWAAAVREVSIESI